MHKIERLLVIEHPLDPTVDYVVYVAGAKTFWYRVEYAPNSEETWEHIPALT